MTGRRAAAALAVAVGLAGCGTPSADLFIVDRAGSLPGAKLHLLVGDGGEVECDGVKREMTSAQLLDARDLLRRLEGKLAARATLPRAATSLVRYTMTGEKGRLSFWDSSPGLTPEMGKLIAFTRAVARGACGRPR